MFIDNYTASIILENTDDAANIKSVLFITKEILNNGMRESQVPDIVVRNTGITSVHGLKNLYKFVDNLIDEL